MATKTIRHYITAEDSVVGATPLEIISTIPNDLNNKKIPISLTICYQKSKPDEENINSLKSTQPSTLLYYHYSIPNRIRTRRPGEDVVGISLLDTNNDWVRDISRKLANAIAKKYDTPCYVSFSTTKTLNPNSVSMDQMYVLKHCIQFINSILT